MFYRCAQILGKSEELQLKQGVLWGKWRQTSKYDCNGMKAVEMWSSMLSTRVNRQQGRVMHDTDSLNLASVRVREGQRHEELQDRISHCACLCKMTVCKRKKRMTSGVFNSFVNLLTDHIRIHTSCVFNSLCSTVVTGCQNVPIGKVWWLSSLTCKA